MIISQNICGSGFFHHLNEAELEDGLDSDAESALTKSPQAFEDDDGVDLPFDTKHFSLFYNNSPSQVDPTYQPVSTLTAKGDEYRKKSGSGIALVAVELLRSDGIPVRYIRTGASPKSMVGHVYYSTDMLRMKRIEHSFSNTLNLSGAAASFRTNYRIRIRITNTLLDVAILQNWIELSLNQVSEEISKRDLGSKSLTFLPYSCGITLHYLSLFPPILVVSGI